MNHKRQIGIIILIITSAFLTLMYLGGQTMALINYDFTVSIGLQESREELTEMGVAINKGFGLGDTVVYIPLLILGIIGLTKSKVWGWTAMIGAMAITAYWPVVALSTLFFAIGIPGFTFTDHLSYSILLSLIFIYGVWGMYYLYSRRNQLIHMDE